MSIEKSHTREDVALVIFNDVVLEHVCDTSLEDRTIKLQIIIM